MSARFWAKVDMRSYDGCWEWTAYKNDKGYGQFGRPGGRSEGVALAHRYAYELVIGRIPDGLVIDHLCRNRGCVNPAHMEAVTQGENVRRGLCAVRPSHCPQGHEYTPENTQENGKCRTCNRDRCNARYRRKCIEAALKAAP